MINRLYIFIIRTQGEIVIGVILQNGGILLIFACSKPPSCSLIRSRTSCLFIKTTSVKQFCSTEQITNKKSHCL